MMRRTDISTDTEVGANVHHLVMDIAWFGVALPATARFLAVYAIRLDASAMLVGLLTALPAMVALLASLVARWYRRQFPDAARAAYWSGFGFRFLFLLPALTPIFPAQWQTLWLLAAVSLPAFAQGLSNIMFLVMMREAVGKSHLTTVVSRRSVLFNLAFGISTLACGLWLSNIRFPANYTSMYVLAFGASLISLWHVGQIRVLNPEPLPPADQPVVRAWRAPGFPHVIFVATMTHVAFFCLAPIVTLLLVEDLGAGEGFISVFALVELLAAALMSVFTSRIVTRIGSRWTAAIGMVGCGISGILIALSPSAVLTLPGAALSGACWTMAAIAQFAFFSENTPSEAVTRYTTFYNQLTQLAIFIGPLVGSQLAGVFDLATVMLIGSGLRLVVGTLIPVDIFSPPRRARRPHRVRRPAVGG
ncbi:MAG: MFS transporter [Chloroflexi bacterium]|nr:MFS transporter [Chloroflexota bacterium]